jgi:Ras-related protein Rab-21
MTVNVSYYQKDLEFDGVKYTFCLWDTAGQEKFNALTNIYYRDAKGAILVYDVTLKETFTKVEKWYEELMVFNSDTVIAIAGNKVDMRKIDVDKSVVSNYCNDNSVDHIYTSAKTGEGLEEIFYKVAKEIASKLQTGNMSKKNKKGLKITTDSEYMIGKKRKEDGSCC